MKRTFTLIVATLLWLTVWGQSPEQMSYQAVVRDASQQVVSHGSVGMQISILQGSATGTVVYAETQTPTSDAHGLVSLAIGKGTSAYQFSAIDWSNGPYFIMTETDPTGGTAYTITGTSQLLSVPFAMRATTAGMADSIAYDRLTNAPDVSGYDQDTSDDFDGAYASLRGVPITITTAQSDSIAANSAKVGVSTAQAEAISANTASVGMTSAQFDSIAANTAKVSLLAQALNDTATALRSAIAVNAEATAAGVAWVATETSTRDSADAVLAGALIGDSIAFAGLVNAEVVYRQVLLEQEATARDSVDALIYDKLSSDSTVLYSKLTADSLILKEMPSGVAKGDMSYYNGTAWVILKAGQAGQLLALTPDSILAWCDAPYGWFTDARDSTLYAWVKIGDQIWMAENLAYLPQVDDAAAFANATDARYGVYDYDGSSVADAKASANYGTYGVLYNWYAAMAGTGSSDASPSGVQGACPAGWHLPSDDEWTVLENALEGDNKGSQLAGNADLWSDGTLKDATSDFGTSGFAALPGGGCSYDGAHGSQGNYGDWWSSTPDGSDIAYGRGLSSNSADVTRNYSLRGYGFSVRCVRD